MKYYINILFILLSFGCVSQMVPSTGENMDFLITSGSESSIKVGDDDHQQVIFFLVPENFENAFYIRVYDPDTFGQNDEKRSDYNTSCSFELYGGEGTHSSLTVRNLNYKGEISGTKMFEETFAQEQEYDNKWYSFGPINPKEGELDPNFKGYIFKMVVTGLSGDDVNLYKFSLSTSKNDNLPIPGGNAFTYEYSIRLKSKRKEIAHFYPFLDEQVVSIKQFNFDFDSDGDIRLFSSVKNGVPVSSSGNGTWVNSTHKVEEKEKGKCMDYQVIKKGNWHNDMVVYIVNQYNIPVPFFAIPLGGVPEPEMKFNTIRQGGE